MHPTGLVDGIGRALRVVPVTEHHAVATGAELADGTARDQVARLIDDFAFQLRLCATDGGHPQFQLV
ncbi:hypothetical protein D3C78_999890 [compost metagenome]